MQLMWINTLKASPECQAHQWQRHRLSSSGLNATGSKKIQLAGVQHARHLSTVRLKCYAPTKSVTCKNSSFCITLYVALGADQLYSSAAIMLLLFNKNTMEVALFSSTNLTSHTVSNFSALVM